MKILHLLLSALFLSLPGSALFAEQNSSIAAIQELSSSRASVAEPKVVGQDLTGENLFQALHDYTFQHTSVGYGTAQRLLPTEVDGIEKDGRKGVICYYSNIFIECSGSKCTEKGDENHDGKAGDFINVEHSWPQSFFSKQEPMRSDMHHLFPTLSVPNGQRGHMPFSVVPKEDESEVSYQTESGSKKTSTYFEPSDVSKGNIARGLLYFAVTYTGSNVESGAFGNDFWDSKIETLMQWNRQDPPDAAEKHRNEVIAKYQGKRNPFIDDPSLVDKIGAAVWKKMH
ncbi:MAG: hypothetical protein GX410_11625 [Elusimicrobia bacterium]|nr:hypothetical protein [Elusimicrobiota bacterium]